MDALEQQSTDGTPTGQNLSKDLLLDFEVQNELYNAMSPEELEARLKADIEDECCVREAAWYFTHVDRLAGSGPGWKLKALDVLLLFQQRSGSLHGDHRNHHKCRCAQDGKVKRQSGWEGIEESITDSDDYYDHLWDHVDAKARTLAIDIWKDSTEIYDPYHGHKALRYLNYQEDRKSLDSESYRGTELAWARVAWTILRFIPGYISRRSIVDKMVGGKLSMELMELVVEHWIGPEYYREESAWMKPFAENQLWLLTDESDIPGRGGECALCNPAAE